MESRDSFLPTNTTLKTYAQTSLDMYFSLKILNFLRIFIHRLRSKATKSICCRVAKQLYCYFSYTKIKKKVTAMELYLIFFCFLLQCTSIYRCALQLKAKMKYNFLFYVHTSFCIFYSFFHFGQCDILFYCSGYIILL